MWRQVAANINVAKYKISNPRLKSTAMAAEVFEFCLLLF
jgi:hypothetical protein